MSRKIILSKSRAKGKRFRVEMIGFGDMKDHMHNFGSDVGKTFIDHSDEKKKSAWIARHSVNKNWDSIHSSIYFSKNLLWNSDSLKQNIKILSNGKKQFFLPRRSQDEIIYCLFHFSDR